MAQLALLPPKESTINFNKGSIDLLKTSQLSLKGINKQLVDRTKAREDAYDDILGIRRKRETLIRSQIRESELEATSIVQKKSFDPLALGRVSSIGGGSILDRILKTVSLLFAGWIIKDLPIWVARAKEFMFRLNKAGEIIKSVLDNTIKIFTSTFGMIDGIRKNLMEFDFSDDSNRIRNSFNELTGSIEEIGVEFENGIKLITTPLLTATDSGLVGTFGGAEAEGPAPDFDTDMPVEGGVDALFKTIGEKEGGYESMNRGESGDSKGPAKNWLGKNLRDMTLAEIMAAQASGRVSAVGKYQIIGITMPGFVQYLESKGYDRKTTKFTPEIQEKYKNYTIERKRPVVGKFITGQVSDIERANLELAAEFASVGVPFDMKRGSYNGELPVVDIKKGESLYKEGPGGNRALISPEKIQAALKLARDTQKKSSNTSQAKTGSLTDSKLSALTGDTGKSQGYKEISTPISPFLKGKSGTLTSGYGKRDGRLHRGYDVGVAVGTPLYAYFPGVMGMNQYDAGGFGYYIVWKDSVYGKHHLFGHLKGPGFLKEGQKFNKGQLLGQSGNTGSSTGPHLHWQIGSSNIFSDTIDPGKWLNSISKPDTEVKVSSPTSPPPAPTLPPPTPSISSAQMSSAAPTPLPYLTPSNKPKDIIAAVQIPSAQNVKTSVPSSEVSNRQTTYSSMIQTYMKKRLLIALSYV